MKLIVKTLKGEKFEIEADEIHTIAQVKGVIESTKAELSASSLKLIHTGKVLKDDDTLDSCGVKEGDFIVVMVAKPKKPTAAVEKEEKKPAITTAAAIESSAEGNKATSVPAASSTSATTPSPSDTPGAVSSPAPNAPDGSNLFPDDVVTNLITMGFPEAEVRHCLRAAHGNPDVAVEFLTNGIPDNVSAAADIVRASNVALPASTTHSRSSSAAGPLQSLRSHPQFNALRRLVQTNPGALQQVLTQIGQQQPDLLAEINANQALFLEMMNEPIIDNESSTTGSDAALGMPPGGMPDPQQMAQIIASLPDEQLQQMAVAMGMNPNQLRQMAASTAANSGNVIRLTADEMAAVDRLTAMGFDRTEAAQAFLACDKNETLAANLLMDSMANGGGVFGGGNDDGNDDGDDDENMYD